MKNNKTGCPVEEAMLVVGGRWRLVIVKCLTGQKKRFNELRKNIPGISQRMLTLDLRALENARLIKRTVYPTVPVTVEYELTKDGERLQKIVDVMQDFGKWLGDRDQKRWKRVECAKPASPA